MLVSHAQSLLCASSRGSVADSKGKVNDVKSSHVFGIDGDSVSLIVGKPPTGGRVLESVGGIVTAPLGAADGTFVGYGKQKRRCKTILKLQVIGRYRFSYLHLKLVQL